MSTAIYAAVQAGDYDLAGKWAAGLVAFSLVFVLAMNMWLSKKSL
jgi:molybdate transport system permease protein